MCWTPQELWHPPDIAALQVQPREGPFPGGMAELEGNWGDWACSEPFGEEDLPSPPVMSIHRGKHCWHAAEAGWQLVPFVRLWDKVA